MVDKLSPSWCGVLGIKKIGILTSAFRNLPVKREALAKNTFSN